MALFSQRKGIRPLKKTLQVESIDQELRNGLWNAIKISVWDFWSSSVYSIGAEHTNQKIEQIVSSIWTNYFKLPLDELPDFDRDHPKSALEIIREYFMSAQWWELYDFLEFLISEVSQDWAEILRACVNEWLESENAAYRFVGTEIAEITDDEEIKSIETAISSEIEAISTHIRRALELLSERGSPDFRNSIKESISAVEAAVRIVAANPKATLGEGIKAIDAAHGIHPALKDGLLKLYGFTSDSSGIRHALTERGINLTYADAKFMLVACSAFANFLVMKAVELKLPIK